SRRDEARRAAREEQLRREAEAAWRARQARLAATREARLEELRRREEELARSREQRRLEQLARLREQWERAFLRRPEVASELVVQVQSIAQLERMLRHAEAEKQELVVRIETLLRREDTRHQQRMNDLRMAFAG